MEGFAGNKRSREDGEESPEAKRIHADLLYGILEDDDVDAGDRESQDLANVMKSLEEEIALPPETATEEIGYLLEASDDELGLPPPAELSLEEAKAGPPDGFGQIWGFEEVGIPAWYEGLVEFGVLPEETFGVAENVVAAVGGSFDGGLFDFSDFYWRPESLPAL